jgi:hypothetical protein
MSHAVQLPELMTQLEIGGDSNPSQTATSASVPWPQSNIPLKTWDDVAQDGNAGQNSTSTISFEAPTFPLTEFTCFPKLPKELRLKTWKHAATIPRNIDLWVGPWGIDSTHGLFDILDRPHYYYMSTTLPPAILSTFQESRQEGLAIYKLSFGTETRVRRHHHSSDPYIYINWSADTLCLMNPDELCFSHATHNHKNIILNLVEQCNAGQLRAVAFNKGNGIWNRHHHGDFHYPGDLDALLFVMKSLRYLQEINLFVTTKQHDEASVWRWKAKFDFATSVQEKWQLDSLAQAKDVLGTKLKQTAEDPRNGNLDLPTIRLCELVIHDHPGSHSGWGFPTGRSARNGF